MGERRARRLNAVANRMPGSCSPTGGRADVLGLQVYAVGPLDRGTRSQQITVATWRLRHSLTAQRSLAHGRVSQVLNEFGRALPPAAWTAAAIPIISCVQPRPCIAAPTVSPAGAAAIAGAIRDAPRV